MAEPSLGRLLALKRVGTTLCGKWRLGRTIGSGGMGTVYEASHRNGFRAAVKVMHKSLSDDAGHRRRFLREARLCNRLRHPNVPLYYDDGDDNGVPFLVMELLEGETCDERLRREGPLHPLLALRIADALLAVLDVAHRRGILHRDIKPQNVFLLRDGRVKLLDFGLARSPRGPSTAVDLAPTSVAVGTPAYMAPEQLRGDLKAIDSRTDLWATGALLFALLTNRWSVGVNLEQLARGQRTIPPLATHLPKAPPALSGLVERALHDDPAQRWQDARSMRQAVRQLYRELKQPPPPPPRPRWYIPAAAALVILASTIALIAASARPPTRLPPGASSVSVLLRATPPSAELFLDGQRLPSNPYSGWLPVDDRDHGLRASSPGYAPKARVISAHHDIEIDLVLEPLPPPAHP